MKKYKASFTVEAAFIVPLILMIFLAVMHLLFYYHDKGVVQAAAYETVAVGTGMKEVTREDLEMYFQKRVRGRTLLFASVTGDVTVTEESIELCCHGEKSGMKMTQTQKIRRTDPEGYIRKIRKLEKIQEGLKQSEDNL